MLKQYPFDRLPLNDLEKKNRKLIIKIHTRPFYIYNLVNRYSFQ